MKEKEQKKEFDGALVRLKAARDLLLDFHKILIDSEKMLLEREGEPVTPAEFLGLLMGDERFEWLRSISKLVVKIDESFELDDGISSELLEELTAEVVSLVDKSDQNAYFKQRVEASLLILPAAKAKRDEIRNLFL